MPRLAKALRRDHTRAIRTVSDRQKIQIQWLVPVRDPDTDRVTSNTTFNEYITGYETQFEESQIDGKSISKFDKMVVLEASEVDDAGLELNNNKTVILDGEVWNILLVDYGDLSIPSEYILHVRKS